MSRETRNRRRIRMLEPVRAWFVTGGGGSEGRGVVHDVSMGGFFVRSTLIPEEGTSIAAALTTGSGWRISVRGTVCWNTSEATTGPGLSGFGVRLTHRSHDYRGFVDGALSASARLPGVAGP